MLGVLLLLVVLVGLVVVFVFVVVAGRGVFEDPEEVEVVLEEKVGDNAGDASC